ncbi:MAG: hypothetical protein JJ975_11890 [Bacteroidia bacterium]|nr:hypothetical protein [Bacteroidia bacterium]
MYKEEKVGFLKSKIKLIQGKLVLDDSNLKLSVNKNNFAALGGLIGALISLNSKPKKEVFDLDVNEVLDVTQGKFGIQKILEIHTNKNQTYKIITKDLDGWIAVLKRND